MIILQYGSNSSNEDQDTWIVLSGGQFFERYSDGSPDLELDVAFVKRRVDFYWQVMTEEARNACVELQVAP